MISPPKAAVSGYADAAQRLRDWIIDENLAPGTPLPRQTDLAKRYGVSILTVSRAMRELQDDGLVVAVRRAGTFVADAPPHLSTYGLLLPKTPFAKQENRYVLALTREAERQSDTDACRIPCYHGVSEDPTGPARRQLDDDLRRRRLAGLIFSVTPSGMQGHSALTLPGLPRVGVMPPGDHYPQMAKVTYHSHTFVARAFQRLADMGCRSVAAVVSVHTYADWDRALRQLAPQYGLHSRPEWLQASSLSHPLCARQATHLLLSHPHDRPDALIIADDNLVEDATHGIAASGAAITAIAHTNFPWPAPAAVPVLRLGCDCRALLSHCLAALRHQQAGHGIPPPTTTDAIFADEYRHAAPAVPIAP